MVCGILNGIQSAQEIIQGHIPVRTLLITITAAMKAIQVAPGGAFPEQVIQFMPPCFELPELAVCSFLDWDEHLAFVQFDLQV
jgi:hypothetical protein